MCCGGLRGDFTVDSASRALQVRSIEGRQASARRDGALHLNARGGAEVVIGNDASEKGARIHGTVRADGLVAQTSGGMAQLFHATGALTADLLPRWAALTAMSVCVIGIAV